MNDIQLLDDIIYTEPAFVATGPKRESGIFANFKSIIEICKDVDDDSICFPVSLSMGKDIADGCFESESEKTVQHKSSVQNEKNPGGDKQVWLEYQMGFLYLFRHTTGSSSRGGEISDNCYHQTNTYRLCLVQRSNGTQENLFAV